ncbi:MAG: hypothetical protein Q8P20_07905 [bacterium]|nr:hypothetical protein [bacterium]
MVETLQFIDLKTKKKFKTDEYTIEKTKNGRKLAIATSPSGTKSARFVSMDFECK